MNNKRRARIKDVINKIKETVLFYNDEIIDNYRFEKNMEECYMELEFILSDESSAYDNVPESLQCGKIGNRIEECIDNLYECLDLINTIAEEYDQEDKQRDFKNNYNCLIDTLSNIIITKRG